MRQRSARLTALECVDDEIDLHTEFVGGCGRGEGVHDVVLAEHLEPDGRRGTVGQVQRERGSGRRRDDVGRANGSALVEAEPEHACAGSARPCRRPGGSSRLSTATSVREQLGHHLGLRRTVASMPPNSPAWASPTFRTTPMSGLAIRMSLAISPMPLAPISATRNRVSSSRATS